MLPPLTFTLVVVLTVEPGCLAHAGQSLPLKCIPSPSFDFFNHLKNIKKLPCEQQKNRKWDAIC